MSHKIRVHLAEGRTVMVPFPNRALARLWVWWYKRYLQGELRK